MAANFFKRYGTNPGGFMGTRVWNQARSIGMEPGPFHTLQKVWNRRPFHTLQRYGTDARSIGMVQTMVRLYDVLRNTTIYYEILRRTTKYYYVYYEILRRTMKYCDVLRNSTTYYEILRRTTKYYDVLRNTTKYLQNIAKCRQGTDFQLDNKYKLDIL